MLQTSIRSPTSSRLPLLYLPWFWLIGTPLTLALTAPAWSAPAASTVPATKSAMAPSPNPRATCRLAPHHSPSHRRRLRPHRRTRPHRHHPPGNPLAALRDLPAGRPTKSKWCCCTNSHTSAAGITSSTCCSDSIESLLFFHPAVWLISSLGPPRPRILLRRPRRRRDGSPTRLRRNARRARRPNAAQRSVPSRRILRHGRRPAPLPHPPHPATRRRPHARHPANRSRSYWAHS